MLQCNSSCLKFQLCTLLFTRHFKNSTYIESQHISPNFYLVIGIVFVAKCYKRRKAKGSEQCAASSTTPQFDNPAYEASVGKKSELRENDYSSVDDPFGGAHVGNPKMPKGSQAKPDRNVCHCTDCGKEDLYEYIELSETQAISGATEEEADEPVYDIVSIPAEGYSGIRNEGYDC